MMIIWIIILIFGLFLTGYIAHKCCCTQQKTDIPHVPSDDLTQILMHEGEKEHTEPPDVPLSSLLGQREWKVRLNQIPPNSTWADIIPEFRDLPQFKAACYQPQGEQQSVSDRPESSECDDLNNSAIRTPVQHESRADSGVVPDHYDWREAAPLANNIENGPSFTDSGEQFGDLSGSQVQPNWGTDLTVNSGCNDESTFVKRLPEDHELGNGTDHPVNQDWLVNSTFTPNENKSFLSKLKYTNGDLPESPCHRERIMDSTQKDSDKSFTTSPLLGKQTALNYKSTGSTVILPELQPRKYDSTGFPGRHDVKTPLTQSPSHQIQEDCTAGCTDSMGRTVSPTSPKKEHETLPKSSIHGCITLSSDGSVNQQEYSSDSMTILENETINVLVKPGGYEEDCDFSNTYSQDWTNQDTSNVPDAKQGNSLLLDGVENHQSVFSDPVSQQKCRSDNQRWNGTGIVVHTEYEIANVSQDGTQKITTSPSFRPDHLKFENFFITNGSKDDIISVESLDEGTYVVGSTEHPQQLGENSIVSKVSDQEQLCCSAETPNHCVTVSQSFLGISAAPLGENDVYGGCNGLSTSPEGLYQESNSVPTC